MTSLAAFFGSGLFFIPFLYIAFYLYLEKRLDLASPLRGQVKVLTILLGVFIFVYAFTGPDFSVLIPSRGEKIYLPASLYLIVVGLATLTLPFYSRFIKFSNKNK